MLKFNIHFKKTNAPSTSPTAYYSKEFEFNDEGHYNNWRKKADADQSYRKIVGAERVYSEAKIFSIEDAKKMWVAALSGKFTSFEEYYRFQYKTNPE